MTFSRLAAFLVLALPLSAFGSYELKMKLSEGMSQNISQGADSSSAWEEFATSNGLPYDPDWNNLDWDYDDLSSLPSEPYPNSELTGGLSVQNNSGGSLSNLDPFSSVTSVDGTVDFGGNANLSDISGLTHPPCLRFLV